VDEVTEELEEEEKVFGEIANEEEESKQSSLRQVSSDSESVTSIMS
jgi:hypothetical protein